MFVCMCVIILQLSYFLQKKESKKAESTVSKFQQDPDYASDAELLAAAGGNIMLK